MSELSEFEIILYRIRIYPLCSEPAQRTGSGTVGYGPVIVIWKEL